MGSRLGLARKGGPLLQAVRRRLAKLFRAAHLERFRPYSRRGSYPWTYQLGPAGHRLLKEARHIEPSARYQPRALHDYSYVIHDLQLNAWILAYRQLLNGTLLEWHGETSIHPPPRRRRAQLALANDWTAEGLNDHSARPVVPDAVLEIERPDGPWPWTFLLEHDRTRRVDKNFDKFRRYDSYLTAWHQDAGFARLGHEDPPYVLFICQDQEQRQLFMAAADHELTGYRWHPATPDQHEYVGRKRILFATELDIHSANAEARRLPPFPPRHRARRGRDTQIRGLKLPGPKPPAPASGGPQSEMRGVELPGPLNDAPTADRQEEGVAQKKPTVAQRMPETATTDGR